MLRLNLVYYGTHDVATDSLILKLAPEYIIGNTPHGLWGEVFQHSNSTLLESLDSYRAAGIKVIGYITGGYEGRGSGSGIDRKWCSLEMNTKLIERMATRDKVNGVFIDECSAFPDRSSKKYLKKLAGLARKLKLLTWANTGSSVFDKWYFTDGGFDLINSAEDWAGQSLTNVEREWGSRISVTGFRPEYTAQDAYRLTLRAWQQGIAYCYICRTYTSLPPWIEEYANLLRGR